MKNMIKQILTCVLMVIAFQLSAEEAHKVKFKSSTEVLAALKANQDKPVEGPFELKILAISKSGFNTRLHTKKDPKDPENIILELSPFMVQYYTKQFDTTVENFFLNYTLAVNGKVTPVTAKDGDKQQTENIIKVYLANQLAHLE